MFFLKYEIYLDIFYILPKLAFHFNLLLKTYSLTFTVPMQFSTLSYKSTPSYVGQVTVCFIINPHPN